MCLLHIEWICTDTALSNFWDFAVSQLVLSTGNGVNGFTLDPSLGEFILTHPDIKVIFVDTAIYGAFYLEVILMLVKLPR